jgi:hypothetical protein
MIEPYRVVGFLLLLSLFRNPRNPTRWAVQMSPWYHWFIGRKKRHRDVEYG